MKALVGLNLIALLIVAVVVLTGEMQSASSLLGSSTMKPAQLLRSTPIGAAEGSDASTSLSAAVNDAYLDAVGGGALNQAGLLAQLQKDVPETRPGAPIEQGGMSVRVLKAGSAAEFCVHPQLSGAYQCEDAVVTPPHHSASGTGNTLAQAQAQAAAALAGQSSGAQPGAGSSAAINPASVEGSGGGLMVLKKAEQLAHPGAQR